MSKQKTVFFGPFIGEFGWELLYWQGWVRRACRTVFKDWHKIAASFPGRYPFYPAADEFRGHPPEITRQKSISSKGYTTDNWFAGLQERGQERDLEKDRRELWEGSLLHEKLLDYYRKKLPDDALILSPAEWIEVPDLPPAFGVKTEKHDDGTFTQATQFIPFKQQVLEPINPTEKGISILKDIAGPDKPLIALLPRARMTRRPDKNWLKENYEALIGNLRRKFPEYSIAIIGEPGGAYFADGTMPEGCIDLINVPPEYRMDIQVAAYKQAAAAIGSISGATLVATACGCPTLQWGYITLEQRYHFENYLNTSMYYYPFPNPAVGEITSLAERFMRWHKKHGNHRTFPGSGLSRPLIKATIALRRYKNQLRHTGSPDQVKVFKTANNEVQTDG